MVDILDQQSIGYGAVPEQEQTQQPVADEPNPEEFQKDLIDHVFDLYTQYAQSPYRRQKVEDSRKNRRNYEQVTDAEAKNWPWKDASSLNMPLTMIACDNVEPRIVAALEGKGNEICRFEDIGVQDPEVDALQTWFNEELIYNVSIRPVCRGIAHDILLDGTVFMMPSYDYQEEMTRDFVFIQTPVIDQQTGMPISKTTGMPTNDPEDILYEETDEIATDEQGNFAVTDIIDPIYEGGKVELLDFASVFVPDDAENWEDTDVVREVSYAWADLQRAYADGVVGFTFPIEESVFTEAVTESQSEGDGAPVKDEMEGQRIYGRKMVPCLEAHIKWDFQTKADRDAGKWQPQQKIVALITRSSRKLIRLCLQRDLNFQNRKQIRRCAVFREYGKTYGTALATKMKEVQEGASDTFNLVINSAYICMIPWYFYTPISGLDKPIELYPGVGVPVADPNGVKFPAFNVDPARFVEFINIFFSLWERISSVSDVQIGRQPEIQGNRAQTATATMMQVQEANVKHGYSSKMMQEEFADLLDIIYDLYYMNAKPNIPVDINGQKVILSKKAMRKRRRFVLTGTTESSNKYVDRMEAESLYTLSSNNPLANPVKFFEDVLKTYNKHNPQDYIDPNVNQLLMAYKTDPQGVMNAVMTYMQALQMAQAQAEMEARGASAGPPARENAA